VRTSSLVAVAPPFKRIRGSGAPQQRIEDAAFLLAAGWIEGDGASLQRIEGATVLLATGWRLLATDLGRRRPPCSGMAPPCSGIEGDGAFLQRIVQIRGSPTALVAPQLLRGWALRIERIEQT